MILSTERSLTEDINFAKKNGYTDEFIFVDMKLRSTQNQISFDKKDCKLIEYAIHEDVSDTSQQSVLFLIQSGDLKGSISTYCNAYADAKLIDFCMSLEKSN